MRLVRHFGWLDLPPNFAPVAAMAMFASAQLPRRLAIIVPFGLMLLSDLIIGWYTPGVMIAVYSSFGVSLILGFWLRRRFSISRLVTASLGGATAFFLITNAAVWAFQSMYPHSWAGLIQTYIAGLPFWRNTVLGDLTYAAIFFGVYQVIVVYLRRRQAIVTAWSNG